MTFFGIYRPNYNLPRTWSKGWKNQLRDCCCIQGVCDSRTPNCKLDKATKKRLFALRT